MTAVATAVSAATLLQALDEAELSHVVIVPDTNQRTLLDALDDGAGPPVLRAATEDDVLGICVGLWLAGQRPVAVIQQLGLFAATNALRAVTHDLRTPLPILAGLYGRDVGVAVEDSGASAVRLCTPLLDALEVPWLLVEHEDEAGGIAPMLASAYEQQRTAVVLLGAPTA